MADGLAALLAAFHDACTGAAPLAGASELVRADGVDPRRRLHAYAHAYWARIAGVLAADLPKLRAVLGEAAFDELVIPYLRAYPTRHPSLREASAHMAQFLDERGRTADADLARLERALIEVFDGPDATPLSRDDLAALAPDEFPAFRLALVPSSAVVVLTTSADDVWDALENDLPPPAPAPGARTVLVWRRGMTVIHRTLDPDEAAVVPQLRAGLSFGEVCALLDSPDRAIELLLRWLDAEALAPDRGTMAA